MRRVRVRSRAALCVREPVVSDTKLRELERRWKETGSPDDEAAYLLERVRVGALSRERLELAAYCGHEGARRAVGRETTALADWPSFVNGLANWDRVAMVIALSAALELVSLPLMEGEEGLEQYVGEVRASLVVLEEWAMNPKSERGRERLLADPRGARAYQNPLVQLLGLPGPRDALRAAASHAVCAWSLRQVVAFED
jgi:hypothetical protein